jgi:hypothetical protein
VWLCRTFRPLTSHQESKGETVVAAPYAHYGDDVNVNVNSGAYWGGHYGPGYGYGAAAVAGAAVGVAAGLAVGTAVNTVPDNATMVMVDGETFGDLLALKEPLIVINATDMVHGTRVSFLLLGSGEV